METAERTYLTDDEVLARLKAELVGRSQADVAREAAIDPTVLSKIVNGHRKLGIGELTRLAAALGLAPADLLVRAVDPPPLFRADADRVSIDAASSCFDRLLSSYLLIDALVP